MSGNTPVWILAAPRLRRGYPEAPHLEERRIPLHLDSDGMLRSDALFAIRYSDAGRVYRRALTLDPKQLARAINVTDGFFPPFRDCHPELLGWAARADLGAPSGWPTDADPTNDDPDHYRRSLDAVVVREHEKFLDEELLRETASLGALARWGTRCRRCGALDSAIRYTASGGIFRVRAEGADELRSDVPAHGFPPLPAPADAYRCVGCDATVTGHVADELFETLPVDDGESEGLTRLGAALRSEDRWEVEGFEQEATANGTAFSGRLKRQGRLVAWFEHRGDGGAMQFGVLPEARANGDADYLALEIRRLTGPGAFEPEEPFVLAVLEHLGL